MRRSRLQEPEQCPACERFIGKVDVCPYCNADSVLAPLMLRLRTLAVLLILAGVVGLFFCTRPFEISMTNIGEITPHMNYRYVRVTGRVVSTPYVVEEEGQITYMSFLIEDQTGRIRVQLSQNTAGVLAANGEMPWPGAVLNVSGALKLSPENKVKLQVQRAGQIETLTRQVAHRIL